MAGVDPRVLKVQMFLEGELAGLEDSRATLVANHEHLIPPRWYQLRTEAKFTRTYVLLSKQIARIENMQRNLSGREYGYVVNPLQDHVAGAHLNTLQQMNVFNVVWKLQGHNRVALILRMVADLKVLKAEEEGNVTVAQIVSQPHVAEQSAEVPIEAQE